MKEKSKYGTASYAVKPKSNANCITRKRVDEMSLDKAGQITDFEYEGLAYTLPEGYIFKDENGNVINAQKIVLEKKKKEYPKTYEECREILKEQADVTYGYKKDVLHSLQKLLVCRDAYWKLYGEEMGLDKPWEPDWKHEEGWIHCITNDCGEICCTGFRGGNKIFAFPTEEMRDVFYKNFKELIEQCKELL